MGVRRLWKRWVGGVYMIECIEIQTSGRWLYIIVWDHFTLPVLYHPCIQNESEAADPLDLKRVRANSHFFRARATYTPSIKTPHHTWSQ